MMMTHVEIAFIHADGTQDLGVYEAATIHVQLKKKKKHRECVGVVTLFNENGQETGRMLYSSVVFIRRTQVIGSL